MIRIDESVIPMNMPWRAGIGKDIPGNIMTPREASDNTVLYDGGIRLTHKAENPTGLYKDELKDIHNQLLYEIDTRVTDTIAQYNGKPLEMRTIMMIKDSLKKTCHDIRGKYRAYINTDFMNMLYDVCMNAYRTEFSKLRDNVDETKEFIEIDKVLYGNPLLIYQYFAA